MGCNCGKPKCDGHCGVSPAVLQINNPSECTLFHRVEVPASMGDSKTNPPKNGAYKNALLYYEADQTSWLYSSDGIPQKLVNGLTNYEDAINLPQINGVTLIGNKSLGDLGITDAIDDAVAEEKAEREAADEAIQDELLTRAVVFDTVADMKASTNLVNGSYAQTLGYYSVNDGGGAFYKIIAKEIPTATGNININDELDAELVIDKNTTVKQFGAYGDNTHDDTPAFNAMLSALNRLIVGYGTYKIDDEINIPNNAQVNIKGKINYTGSDYCFNIDQLTYRELFIDSFESENGGMFSIAPSNTKFVSFCKFKVNYAVCAKHVFNFDATNGIITTISLDGIRWRGSTESTIKLFIDTQHASGTFLTEINIKNADIWTTNSIYGIDAENKASDVEIQFNLYAVDLENSKGVSCKGKITTLGLYECRFQEITGKQDWLSFDGYLPQVTINGLGYIYPDKIKTSNVTAKNYFISTNLTIVDQITSYNYEGGGLLAIDRFNPYVKKQVWKDISSEISNHEASLTLSKSGGIFNWITINTNSYLTLTIPNRYEILPELIITNVQPGISFTITNGSGTTTIPSFEYGVYKFFMVGNGIRYIKLD